MDAKYLAEIRTRDNAELPETAAPVFRDRHALLAEVERQDQQIATLKADKKRAEKALELACRYHRFDDFKTVQAEMDFFTKQAQEQEGHDG